jgi:hypothetical protein
MVENKNYTIKEEIFLFTCDQKLSNCGYGEWIEECDKITFDYLGHECMVHRVFHTDFINQNIYFGGHLCGYVKVPENHVFHTKETIGNIQKIHCHGGVTYNDNNLSLMHSIDHWIGFDCAHSSDIIPSCHSSKKQQFRCFEKIYRDIHSLVNLKRFPVPTYKNIFFCIQECLNIVDQLIGIEKCSFCARK